MPPAKRIPGASFVAVLRAVGLLVWLYALAIVFVPACFTALPRDLRFDPARRRVVDFMIRLWSRLTVWPFFSVRLEGLENLPPPGKPCVYVANHQSFMDILSAFHIPRSFKFISKASIFKIPCVGWSMRAADHIGLEREDKRSQMEVFRKSVKKLQEGASLFIFPEGTRSKDGVMLDFKAKGAFKMASRAKVPIVPVTILGTGRIMPGGKEYFLFRSGSGVRVIVHPQIPVEKVTTLPDDELVATARKTIASGLPESYRGAGR